MANNEVKIDYAKGEKEFKKQILAEAKKLSARVIDPQVRK